MLTLLVLCFQPTIIAIARNNNPLGIFLLNFFLGWTIVFWWVALIWSLVGRPQVRYVYVHPYRLRFRLQPLRHVQLRPARHGRAGGIAAEREQAVVHDKRAGKADVQAELGRNFHNVLTARDQLR